MPTAVQAYNVKVASPGDAAMEMVIARDVIGDWNSRHALERKQVLLPFYREQHAEVSADLLVAFFCAAAVKSKSPIRESLAAEIARHQQAGCPVLIYFSEARADFAETEDKPEEELLHLREQYGARAVIGAYSDEKELRAEFARDLERVVCSRFQTEAASAVLVKAEVAEESLSECAQTLLSEACEDFEAYIGRTKVGASLKIQANGKQLVTPDTPEVAGKWDGAFHELLSGGYIKDAGYNGQLFQISPKGFAFLKTLGKTPVGYIAEMGNM